jgi:hypothetical protein
MMNTSIYACDVGSTIKRRFAWKRIGAPVENVSGQNFEIDCLVESLRRDFENGLSVALGFEAPLFLPVPQLASQLSKGRVGDSTRSCFAPAGSSVATLAVHQAAWILQAIRTDNVRFTLAPTDWPPVGSEKILFCWEAFVSGSAKARCAAHPGKPQRNCQACSLLHQGDADIALKGFREAFSVRPSVSAITASPTLCLIGAAALWSGWTTDTNVLREQVFVVRPGAKSVAKEEVSR